MMIGRRRFRRIRNVFLAAVCVPVLVVGAGSVAAAAPPAPTPDGAPIVLPPARGPVAPAAPLPAKVPGAVPVDRHRTAAGATTAAPQARTAAPLAAPSAAAAAVAPVTTKTGLRALVIALDGSDFGLPTWTSMLDRTGAAYDVLLARNTPITPDTFLRPDGAGKYNAILLTDAMLLAPDATGAFVSALDGTEWNSLWAYERDFKVRQVALYASYGAFPEDYCLRAGTEGGVGATPLSASLATAGKAMFPDLKATVAIPIVQSYVYRDTVAAGCAAQPLLTAGTAVLGVQSTSTDGRERAALTFTSNQNLLQADLLTYGLFRWASRGLYLGETRHFLNVDVDDWFNTSDEQLTNGTLTTWSMSGADALNARTQQNALRSRFPLANAFRFSMAFNGETANPNALALCLLPGLTSLDSASKCMRNDVRWINHTFTHPKMNFTDYPTSLAEIQNNLTLAQRMGLPTSATVLKTGEYSGLGTYNPNPTNDIDPPTDFGLAAANPNLLNAARAAGVKYLHGNMSFASQRPTCFNCTTKFPQPEGAGLQIVPDWPTNIAYFSTTPAEETAFYNSFYGPGGRFPFYPTAQTYAQVIDNEATLTLSHITTGSAYTHTLHIGNLRNYSGGKTLATDWLDATLAKYSALYAVPLLSPDWPALAAYTDARSAHVAGLAAGADAVYDRSANTVTVTAPVAAKVTVSGARTAGFTTYGTEVSAPVTLAPGVPVVFTPSLRS